MGNISESMSVHFHRDTLYLDAVGRQTIEPPPTTRVASTSVDIEEAQAQALWQHNKGLKVAYVGFTATPRACIVVSINRSSFSRCSPEDWIQSSLTSTPVYRRLGMGRRG